jgi:hypothetical protein
MTSVSQRFTSLSTAQKVKYAGIAIVMLSTIATAITLILIYTRKEKSQRKQLDIVSDTTARELSRSPKSSSSMTDRALLDMFMPVYHLDYREKIRPVSLETYVSKKTLVEDGSVTGAITASPNTGNKYLHYFLYFPEDGGLLIAGKAVGAHAYDMEHIIVEVNIATESVVGVLYQPHGSREHYWIREKVDLVRILANDRRPAVYVSRGKHGNYPVSGTIYRYGGFASDVTDKPVRQKYHVVPASASLMKLKKIDGEFHGISKRLTHDFAQKPTERLDRVRRRMLFEMPPIKPW